jgi:hypothetical protein
VLGDGTVILHSFEQVMSMFTPERVGDSLSALAASYGLWTGDAYTEVVSRPQPTHHVLARRNPTLAGPGGRTIQLPAAIPVPALLTPDPEAAVAVGETRFVLASDDPFELRYFGPRGALERIVRIERTPVPVSADDQDRVRESMPAPVQFEGHAVRPHRPAFGRLVFGDGDELWIIDHYDAAIDGPGVPHRVTVLGGDGRPLAHLELLDPVHADLRLLRYQVAGRGGRLVAVVADALGVKRLLVFEVER